MIRLPAVFQGRGKGRTVEQPSADEDPPSAAGDRPSDGDDRSAGDDAPGLGSALRKALLALGVLALAYLVARRIGSAGPTPATEEVREPATAAPGGDRRGGPVGSATGEGTAEDLPGVERSSEEIAERAEPDVQAEPAEPGEMTVDEEVVDDIVDEAEGEESEAEAGEESGTGEETESEAESEDDEDRQ